MRLVAPDQVEIDPKYLDLERDREDMRLAFRQGVALLEQPAFDFVRQEKYNPAVRLDSDADCDRWIQQNSHSAYHLSCTASMGKVCDTHGRVMGIDNLRVVDASLMPDMTSGNLNAPTLMMAAKLSDHILFGKYLSNSN